MTPARATLPTRDLVLTRTFHVSPDRLWKAWTIGDRVMQWWGPAGFVSPSARMDVRVGGTRAVNMDDDISFRQRMGRGPSTDRSDLSEGGRRPGARGSQTRPHPPW